MTSTVEMPRYQSHKKVWALQIKAVDGHKLSFENANYADVEKPSELFARYKPVAGDYLVVYDDGYESFSPREPFEAGYTAL